jgi:starch synthase (maltosyl-transferring)
VWGIYSGFELCEATALPDSEEYRASEKYEIRVRDWSAPGSIADYIARLNAIRRENPALHTMAGLRFYPANSPHVLFYGKLTPARDNVILVAINLDPFATHEATLQIPLAEIGIADDETYELHELLGGDRRLVRGAAHVVTLDPRAAPALIYRVGRWRRRERDFDYYA